MAGTNSAAAFKIVFLVVLSFLPLGANLRLTAEQEGAVASMAADNGFGNVTLVDTAFGFGTARLAGTLMSAGVLTTARKEFPELSKMTSYRENFIVLVDDGSDLLGHLPGISRTTPKSVLVVTEGGPDLGLDRKADRPFFFFWMDFEDDSSAEFDLHQVINSVFFTSPAVDRVGFASNDSFAVEEGYDLQGRELLGITLPFPPYLEFENCSAVDDDDDDVYGGTGVACGSSSGLFVDLMSTLGHEYNFTFEDRMPKDGDWGLEGVGSSAGGEADVWSGSNDSFVGVVGDVVYGRCDYSPSTWAINSDRDLGMDFAPVFLQPFVLALTPQSLEVDAAFFLRPFTRPSWISIALTTVLVLLVVVPAYLYIPAYEFAESHMIASTSGWIFFTLLNAYYGGALTMFFTSDPPLPFSTAVDVMRNDAWKLKFLSGNSELFAVRARGGDPDYAAYYAGYEADPAAHEFPDILSGLEELRTGPVVMHINLGILTSAFKVEPVLLAGQRVETFAVEDSGWANIVLPKRLRQSGVMERLVMDWEGEGLPKADSQPLEVREEAYQEDLREKSLTFLSKVLTLGQTVLVYFIVGLSVLVSLTILIMELTFKRYGLEERFGRGGTCCNSDESGCLPLPSKGDGYREMMSPQSNMTYTN